MSETIALESAEEEILLYFDLEREGLSAQTFAHALLSFEQVCRSINDAANPGQSISIDFIRSEQGSLRAVIRIFVEDAKSLLKAPLGMFILPFLMAILVNKITSEPVNIVVTEESYVVRQGAEKIILPKAPRAIEERVEHDPKVRENLKQFFNYVESDTNVSAVDFRLPQAPDAPVLPVDRKDFAALRDMPEILDEELPSKREQKHNRVTVVVITAVLTKSKRKWEFLWSGQKISADIRDEDFFVKLARHEYEFGQGDTLLVDLVAEQVFNPVLKAYENKGFHISRVYQHSKGPRQKSLL